MHLCSYYSYIIGSPGYVGGGVTAAGLQPWSPYVIAKFLSVCACVCLNRSRCSLWGWLVWGQGTTCQMEIQITKGKGQFLRLSGPMKNIGVIAAVYEKRLNRSRCRSGADSCGPRNHVLVGVISSSLLSLFHSIINSLYCTAFCCDVVRRL